MIRKIPTSLSNNYITYIIEEDENTLWIGTLEGIEPAGSKRVAHLNSFMHDPEDPSSLSNNEVRSLYYRSRNNTLWAGTGFIYDGDFCRLAV